jgi:hypothetical protein
VDEVTAPITLNAPDLRRARTLLFWLLMAAEAEPVAEACGCHPDWHELGVHAPGVVA